MEVARCRYTSRYSIFSHHSHWASWIDGLLAGWVCIQDGFTPLAVALQQGHDRVVAVLLENDSRSRVRLPALHIAAKKDDVQAATLLLQTDTDADTPPAKVFAPYAFTLLRPSWRLRRLRYCPSTPLDACYQEQFSACIRHWSSDPAWFSLRNLGLKYVC